MLNMFYFHFYLFSSSLLILKNKWAIYYFAVKTEMTHFQLHHSAICSLSRSERKRTSACLGSVSRRADSRFSALFQRCRDVFSLRFSCYSRSFPTSACASFSQVIIRPLPPPINRRHTHTHAA